MSSFSVTANSFAGSGAPAVAGAWPPPGRVGPCHAPSPRSDRNAGRRAMQRTWHAHNAAVAHPYVGVMQSWDLTDRPDIAQHRRHRATQPAGFRLPASGCAPPAGRGPAPRIGQAARASPEPAPSAAAPAGSAPLFAVLVAAAPMAAPPQAPVLPACQEGFAPHAS
ncbi:hypothetical protein [Roseomonas haemaphysalidis]|uniref:Uncharacterized protein n=1 Tax=Roseomonas haemaphysalidis TaxID=2768162 RepID=A0ABS3KSW9_9PROT|nr:hypothetical protein [Roseomonas haemaphysalidis]MBO1080559.1 hypothetical protein [Roseomonas haemaphysalidis]